MSTISVEFSLDEDIFFDTPALKTDECNILNIKNVPSALKGLQLLSQKWFQSKIFSLVNLICVNLRIHEEISKEFNEKPQIFDFDFKTSILITLQSNFGGHASKSFWKISQRESFYTLLIDDDESEEITSFFHETMVIEMKDGNSGILKPFETRDEVKIHEIGDSDHSNLLILAAFWIRPRVVQNLLNHEFDIDSCDDLEKCAIDYAWEKFIEYDDENDKKEECNKIIQSLLEANSRYPYGFEYEKASKEVKKFVDVCENMHQDIDRTDFEALKLKLDEHPNLVHFYNRKNQSLMAYAFERKKYGIINYFDRCLTIGSHEDLKEMYKNVNKRTSKSIRLKHQQNAKIFPEAHLMALKFRSRIGHNDQFSHKKWKFVEEAFDTINENKFCSKILKVAAEFSKVKIFFDFKHESTYYMDPKTSTYSKGIIYEGGTIIIGAKNLTDHNKKFQVFGVLAHELCHLAVYLSFMNRNFDPFPMGENEEKRRFTTFVMADCKEKENHEKIVGNVFKSYPEKLQDSEMIVTVPQMMIQYHKNEEKIEELRKIFDELFTYSTQVVEPELDKALPVLRLLEDEGKALKFEDLTVPMKAKIFHSTIKFQGEETSFFELIGNDPKILSLLTVENIRKVLMKNEKIEIGTVCTVNLEYGVIERSFVEIDEKLRTNSEIPKNLGSTKLSPETSASEKSVDFSPEIHSDTKEFNSNIKPKIDFENNLIQNSSQNSNLSPNTLEPDTNRKSFDEITDQLSDSRIFILADHAGTGKTTIFMDSVKKLKQRYKNFWISFINLRKYGSVFDEYRNKSENLCAEDVEEILLQIVDPKCELEAQVFSKRFLEGKTILLFDGVDEISPKHTQLLVNMFKNMVNSRVQNNFNPNGEKIINSNQLWVSTRPHYAGKLENLFKISSHKFSPYTEEERENFITEILKSNKINEAKEQKRIISLVVLYISTLHQQYRSKNEIDNPLMIQIITELYINNQFKLDISNQYGLYAAMTEKQKNKIGDKIPNSDRDKDSKLNVWDIHRILALILVIGDDYEEVLGFKLDELLIIRKWKRVKKNWTSDMIQRYGFVTVDLENSKDERASIDFMHRTYAEFFVAQLFVDFIFDDDLDDESDEDIKRKFDIFTLIIDGRKDLKKVCNFITCYIKNEARIKKLIFHGKVKNLFIQKISKIYKISRNPKEIISAIKGYSPLAYFDTEIATKLWKLDEERNLLEESLLEAYSSFHSDLADPAEICFGPNWHERFNKSGEKLITDEEIQNFRDDVVRDWEWRKEKRLLRICDFIDKNFGSIDKDTIFKKFYFNYFGTSKKIQFRIISILQRVFDRDTFLAVCMVNISYLWISAEALKLIFNYVEKKFDGDREGIRKLLFKVYRANFRSPLLKAVRCNSTGVFNTTKDFYIKYKNSWKEIQSILMDCRSDDFLAPVEKTFYHDYKKFIEDAFGADIVKISEKIEVYFKNGGVLKIFRINFEILENFLVYIFSNDAAKITAILEKIVFY